MLLLGNIYFTGFFNNWTFVFLKNNILKMVVLAGSATLSESSGIIILVKYSLNNVLKQLKSVGGMPVLMCGIFVTD